MALKERALLAAVLSVFAPTVLAQTPPAQTPPAGPTVQDRIARMMSPGTGAWTVDQLASMALLRDAALTDPYAMTELRHLTDNIGPRISGSPQAQAAVDYVAAEMRALGADVQLEKTTVPTGSVAKRQGPSPPGPARPPTRRKKSFSPPSAAALPPRPTASPPRSS